MESIIIKKVRIVDPNSTHNGQRCDVLIVEGNIVEIASDLKTPDDADVWEAEGAAISPGWVDLQAHFYDPGAEHKEGLKNGGLGRFPRRIYPSDFECQFPGASGQQIGCLFFASANGGLYVQASPYGLCISARSRNGPIRNA